MTNKVIKKIKEAYNINHVDKITEQDPAKIWDALREKIKSCDREDCWLEQLKDEKLKKKFMSSLFAPFHPNEWKENPSTWLSNHDILNVLTQYEKLIQIFDLLDPHLLTLIVYHKHMMMFVYGKIYANFHCKDKLIKASIK